MGGAAVEHHMIACVNESLSLYLMSNARFMCERLVADFPSEVRLGHLDCARYVEIGALQQAVLLSTFDTMQANIFLLATCCYRSDQAHRAYHLLMGKLTYTCCTSPMTNMLHIAAGLPCINPGYQKDTLQWSHLH